jgi:PAS domain S-box-containing protein
MMDSINFSAVFQSLPGNYIILLPNAPIFTIAAFNNKRAEQTFTRKEHIGKGIFEAFPDNPDDPLANGVAMLTTSLQSVMKEKRLHEMAVQKYDIPAADGSAFEERYWLPRNIPVLDEEGDILYIVHHVQDVTAEMLAGKRESAARQNLSEEISARKRIEDAQETISLALESADLGPYEINLLTDEMITTPRFNAIWGFDQNVTRATFANAVHDDDKPRRLKAHEESLRTGRLFYEVRVVRSDRSVRWVRVNGRVMYDNQHKAQRLLGLVQDITQQRAFTEEMTRMVQERTKELHKTNERLERSNSELEQFAYVTSHDLQAPLRKIQVYASRIQSNETNPQSAGDLEKILTSADRMRGLMTDLLDYSRLSNNNTNFQRTDLNEVLRQVLSDYELNIAQQHAIIQADRLETIHAVPLHMNQLFINLVGNALKFARENVPVIVTIKGSKLAEEKKENLPALVPGRKYYEIVISDNGIGFEQADADDIFTLFHRLDKQNNYGGHGIGLAICSKVVKYHQGIIRAESVVNKGTSFTVILPCDQN